MLTLKSGTLCVLDPAKFDELARFDVASVLDNGLRVILDPANTDVVAVRVAGLGGLRAAPASLTS